MAAASPVIANIHPIGADTSPAMPPWVTNPDATIKWLNVKEFAVLYRRSERTIRLWCNDGTLVEFGFSVYQDPGLRWWIASSTIDPLSKK